ncbi:hypothetical protein PG991_001027 [Apiospora marii]|uniref:Cytochrome P450 n=1 Tax=Apiospora marii TaxID=335849 RepID=A0ABR1STL5_9PEZI
MDADGIILATVLDVLANLSPYSSWGSKYTSAHLLLMCQPFSESQERHLIWPGTDQSKETGAIFRTIPVNPKQKSLIHHVEDVYRTQLLPGDQMDIWSRRFLDSVQSSLYGIRSLDFCTLKSEDCGMTQDDQLRAVSLYSLVSFFSVQATAHAMFGPHLHEINPRIVHDMLSFNEHVWMIVFRCPSILSLPVGKHRDKLMNTTRKFVRLHKEQRSQASWAMTSVLDGMENVGMDMESRASMILMIFWAAVSNEHNSCFWLLTNLLYDDSLMRLAQSETESAWKTGQLDIKTLCANCPNLDSIFNEVLRLNNTAAAARVVSQTVILGGKELRPGSTVVMPFRQLHLAEDAWGADVSEFRPSRFLERKSLARSPSFRPFGGGSSLCPGRTLVRHEVFGFLSVLLRRFHLSLATDKSGKRPPFPRLNSITPSFGINGPVPGMDVIIHIAERK